MRADPWFLLLARQVLCIAAGTVPDVTSYDVSVKHE
jgi:hypothetical protein